MENSENTNHKIMIPLENGEKREAECLGLFKIKELDKEFLIYSFGERDSNEMEVVHASVVTREADGGIVLDDMDSAEWDYVKEFMREAIKSEGE